METPAPVALAIAHMRRLVEREGGCIVWSGAAQFSPADNIMRRVSRKRDFDGEASLVSSVPSKKIAAGSTHVLVEVPVGVSAKVLTAAAATSLVRLFNTVVLHFGLTLRIIETDGQASGWRADVRTDDRLEQYAAMAQRCDRPVELVEGGVMQLGTANGPAAPARSPTAGPWR